MVVVVVGISECAPRVRRLAHEPVRRHETQRAPRVRVQHPIRALRDVPAERPERQRAKQVRAAGDERRVSAEDVQIERTELVEAVRVHPWRTGLGRARRVGGDDVEAEQRLDVELRVVGELLVERRPAPRNLARPYRSRPPRPRRAAPGRTGAWSCDPRGPPCASRARSGRCRRSGRMPRPVPLGSGCQRSGRAARPADRRGASRSGPRPRPGA